MTEPGDEQGARLEAEGAGREPLAVRFNRVGMNFFSSLGVPILAGRGFEARDAVHADAGQASHVIVNRSLADRLFGGSALGKRIRYVSRGAGGSAAADSGRWYVIAGIVSDFPSGVSAGMDDSNLKVYHAAAMGEVQPLSLMLQMRSGSPGAFSQRLRELAVSVDADLHLRDIRSLDEALRKEQWIRRVEAGVLLAVTLSVVLLSSAGIYALMSFTVSQRRREIGIRMAIGASRMNIVVAVFSRALLQLGGEIATGAVLALAFAQVSGASLTIGDAPAVMAAVVVFMIAVGLLAAMGPTRRSLRIQATDALREQWLTHLRYFDQ